jgi:hypothetical protein
MEVHNKCINYPLFFVVSISLESALNAEILVLSMREFMGLKTDIRTKLSLRAIFLIGGA